MDIRYGGLKDYRELFAKLQREAQRFDVEPNDDNLFNAMVTAWSLADWLREDVAMTSAMDEDLVELTGRDACGVPGYDRLSAAMQICKDIANGSKHAVIKRYTPKVGRVAYTDGTYGSGIYGFGTYGGGGEAYAIVVGERMYNARDVLTEAIEQFAGFFTKYDLI